MRKRWKQRLLAGALGAGSTYTQKVQALGPIAYWPLAESGGSTANDESGNGRAGAYTSVTLGAQGIGDGRTAASFDGSASFVNVYSASLAGAFSPTIGTVAIWGRVSSADVWSDASNDFVINLGIDSNNYVRLIKSSTSNQLQWAYRSNAVSIVYLKSSVSPTNWFHLALVWSVSGSSVTLIPYYNGAQDNTPAIGTAVDTWTLGSTQTAIGSQSGTSAATPWSGTLAHAALFARALSAAEIASLAIP